MVHLLWTVEHLIKLQEMVELVVVDQQEVVEGLKEKLDFLILVVAVVVELMVQSLKLEMVDQEL